MKQLSKDELDELDRLWDELARLYPYGSGPPMTDDEAIGAGLDALLAGVFSSAGEVGRDGLALFEQAVSSQAHSPALRSILDRVAAVLGLAGGTQGTIRP